MYKSTVLIGLLVGIVLIGSAVVAGGSPGIFVDLRSLLIVFGGVLASLIISTSWENLRRLPQILKVLTRDENWTPDSIIQALVGFAEKARREGLLALEDEVLQLDDEFLKKGVQLVVDGTDPELVRSILETEISFIEERHQQGQALFETMGAFAPAYGMIGTLIGLIAMLDNLDEPSSVGPAMATALITTLYGTLLANLVFLPLAKHLKAKTQKEVLFKEVMVEGILSIQAGENPRIVEEKLKAFLAPDIRAADDEEHEEELVVSRGA